MNCVRSSIRCSTSFRLLDPRIPWETAARYWLRDQNSHKASTEARIGRADVAAHLAPAPDGSGLETGPRTLHHPGRLSEHRIIRFTNLAAGMARHGLPPPYTALAHRNERGRRAATGGA